MDNNLIQIKNGIYDTCKLEISNFLQDSESKEYDASSFDLNRKHILSRTAKITPKKVGQFVTFWKRNDKGIIEPFNETDQIDYYAISVRKDNILGQFVFPKSILIKKGIISTKEKEGKRGFRVYPSWDTAKNNQAIKTQQWQLDYFYTVNEKPDFNKIINLYNLK